MWSKHEEGQLRELTIDPARHGREEMILLAQHFQEGGTLYSVTDKGKPVKVSQEFARKVRGLTQEGTLDWLLTGPNDSRKHSDMTAETPAQTAQSGQLSCPQVPQLRELLKAWLAWPQLFTVQVWLHLADEKQLSPSALLSHGNRLLENGGLTQATTPPLLITEELLRAWGKLTPEELWSPAPYDVTRDPQFPRLQEHLRDDTLWNDWQLFDKGLKELTCHASFASHVLAWYIIGATLAPARAPAPEKALERVVHDPDYRDTLSSVLKPAFKLIGGELISRGLAEGGFGTFGLTHGWVVGWSNMEMRDALQRTSTKPWCELSPSGITRLVDQLWQGQAGPGMELLGKDAVIKLLQLWQVAAKQKEAVTLRLTELMNAETFPGSCVGCLPA